MVGKTFTYLIGSETSALFFNSQNHNLNAEEVYSRLVTPVFGKGVAYDVPNSVSCQIHCVPFDNCLSFQLFMEQKRMLKQGLSIAHFRRYIPLIEKETINYFERWGDSGQESKTIFIKC